MKSPLDEIFKSLGSLKEELNEQNKLNVKQKNLEKIKQFLLERKGFLDEDFKSQEQNYINQGIRPQIVKSYIERFKTIRDKNYRQLNDQIHGLENVKDRKNIDSYKTFKELETIVDYVGGQVDLEGTSLGEDIQIDGQELYENDVFEIYYANSPRACIKYKGDYPYSWCVSQIEGNMYYTYRFGEGEPTFYFVKIKDRTKKELKYFDGHFADKYHFFVLQVLKYADINNKTDKQYVVTSAMNEGDVEMSWNDIVAIDPRIANLQALFKPVELLEDEEEFYEKFKDGADDETFCKFNYTLKKRYIDVFNLLSDKQFECSPDDLKNYFIGLGFGLSETKFDLIKNNKNLLRRYRQITERKIDEYLKGAKSIKIDYTQFLVLPEDRKKQVLLKLKNDDISKFLRTSKHLFYSKESKEHADNVINMLFNIGGKEFISNLNTYVIDNLLTHSSDSKKIIDYLLTVHAKELTPSVINFLLKKSSEPLNQIKNLINIIGREFLINLNSDIISELIRKSSNLEELMNILGERGKEYIKDITKNINTYLKGDKINDLLRELPNDKIINIINILFKFGGKDFITNLSIENIQSLFNKSKEVQDIVINNLINNINELKINITEFLLKILDNPEELINKLGNNKKQFIENLKNYWNTKSYKDSLYNMLRDSKNPKQILDILGENTDNLFDLSYTQFNLLRDSINPEQIMEITNIKYLDSLQPDKIYELLIKSPNPEGIMNIFGYDNEKVKKIVLGLDEYITSAKNSQALLRILKKYNKNIDLRDYYYEQKEYNSPINEIFKSLTSLQEELTEQRKVTIKETNLMKVQNFIKMKKNNQ
jgi:hypothetical protein